MTNQARDQAAMRLLASARFQRPKQIHRGGLEVPERRAIHLECVVVGSLGSNVHFECRPIVGESEPEASIDYDRSGLSLDLEIDSKSEQIWDIILGPGRYTYLIRPRWVSRGVSSSGSIHYTLRGAEIALKGFRADSHHEIEMLASAFPIASRRRQGGVDLRPTPPLVSDPEVHLAMASPADWGGGLTHAAGVIGVEGFREEPNRYAQAEPSDELDELPRPWEPPTELVIGDLNALVQGYAESRSANNSVEDGGMLPEPPTAIVRLNLEPAEPDSSKKD